MTRDTSRTVEYFRRGSFYHARYPYIYWGPGARINIGSYINPIGYPPGKGEFEEFFRTIEQCIPYTSRTISGFLSGADSLCQAEFAFFRGDLNDAEQHAREAVFKAREKGQYEIESKSYFYLLRIQLCNGNISARAETWEQMEAQLDIPDYINRYVIYDIMTGWFYAHTGETNRIASWLWNEFEESNLNLLFHNFETLVKAKSLFARKQYGETLKFLERKEVREGLGSFYLGMLEICTLKTAVLSRMGDEETALKNLEAAYRISLYNTGDCLVTFDMPFIELGEDMRTLAGTALSSEKCTIPRPWLEIIRNKASVYAKKFTMAKEQYRNSEGEGEVPFLSSQELSILAGISQGSTREEIARNYSLSISTVKNIIKTIYDKLGAVNRADAIRIATKLRIL